MPRYICEKCGETGYSKNIATRNLFCNDQIASIMTNIYNVRTERNDADRRVVIIEAPYSDTNPDQEDDQLEMQVVKNLQSLTDEEIIHWLCDHNWKLIPGTGEPID